MPAAKTDQLDDDEIDVEVQEDADETDVTDEADEVDQDDESGDDDELGEAGTKALKAERDKNKTLRRQLRELKAGQRADPDAAAKAAEEKYKPIIVRQAARSAFTEAGLLMPKGKEQQAVKRALKLLDLDDIDLSDDGDVEGLSEQITELKDTFPDLFARKGARRVDGADRGGAPAGKRDFADQLAAQL